MASQTRHGSFAYLLAILAITVNFNPSATQWSTESNDCTTPDKKIGMCETIYNCQPMKQFLETVRKPLSQADRSFLFSYHCGYEKNTVKVCCPDSPIQRGGGETGSVDNVRDITRHPNVNLVPLVNCGVIQSDDKILNGNVTALFEFPWMALLRYSDNGKDKGFRCGGTLINDRYVLTAAHCVTNLGTRTLTSVRLGEYDIQLANDCESHFDGDTVCADPVQDFTLETTVSHPNYNTKTFANDIGLIRLGSKANISVDSVKPVCLPIADAIRNYDPLRGIVTGWGRTTTRQQSNVLMKVDLPVMAPDECKRRYEKIAPITDQHICAGGIDEKDSCGGDSGGPLQVVRQYVNDVRYVQYGIVSFGPDPCSTRGLPGVYTKINKYLQWILDNIKP